VETTRGLRDPKSPEEAKEMIINEIDDIRKCTISTDWRDRIEKRMTKIEGALNKAFSAVEKCDFRELLKSFDEAEEAIGCGLPVYRLCVVKAPSKSPYGRESELGEALRILNNNIMPRYYDFVYWMDRLFIKKCGEPKSE